MAGVHLGEGLAFDHAFYVSYYPDLAGFAPRAAEAHFHKWGRSEGRHPNASALLNSLQRTHGALPEAFEPAVYRSLNPDLEAAGLSDLQATEHYLKIGRGERRMHAYADWLKRSDGRRRPGLQPAALVHRSWAADQRHDLALLFGPDAADDVLTRSVMRAQAAVARSTTIAASFLAPAVLGRFLLSAPKNGSEDFGDLRTQLDVLFYALFACPNGVIRRAAELEVVNLLALRAVRTEVAACAGGLPPLTLFMLAVRSARPDFEIDRDLGDPDTAVAEFFGRDAVELGVQMFVTAEQRAALRRPDAEGRPLALGLRKAGWTERVARRVLLGDAETLADWFWREGAWALAMDYVLDGDQVKEGQIRVESEDGVEVLVVPPLLAETAPSVPADRAAVQRWLRQRLDPAAFALPEVILSPSALELAGGLRPGPHPAPHEDGARKAPVAGTVRPGELVRFGKGANGEALLITGGWKATEGAEAWMDGPCAQVALPIDAPGAPCLDLFLDLRVGEAETDLDVRVLWNGRPVSCRRRRFGQAGWMHVFLGRDYRPPTDLNVLTLWTPGHAVHADEFVLALQQLMLAAR